MQMYDAAYAGSLHWVFHFYSYDEEAENNGMAMWEMLQRELMDVGWLLNLLLAVVGSSGCNLVDTQRLVANRIEIITCQERQSEHQ